MDAMLMSVYSPIEYLQGILPMLVVHIEKPANMTLATWFRELRVWLDQHSCEETSFSPSGRIIDRLTFNLIFQDDNKAGMFVAHFTRYAPSIRRTMGSERSISCIARTDGSISDEVMARLKIAP